MTKTRLTLAECRTNLVGRTINRVDSLSTAEAATIQKNGPRLVLTLDDGMMMVVRLDEDLE